MTRSAISLALVVLVALPSAIASAQPACVEGRVSTPETQGRCCWPGQIWSAEHARCSGPPQCPAGRIAEGDACVVDPSVPAQAEAAIAPPLLVPVAPPPPPAAVIVALPPPAGSAWPDGGVVARAANPRIEGGPDGGLVAAGVTLFTIGYLVQASAAITAFLTLQTRADRHCGDEQGALALIPIGGPIAMLPHAGTCQNWDSLFGAPRPQGGNYVAAIIGAAGAALALPGLIMALVGQLVSVPRVVFDPLSISLGDARLRVSAAPTLGGDWLAGATLTF